MFGSRENELCEDELGDNEIKDLEKKQTNFNVKESIDYKCNNHDLKTYHKTSATFCHNCMS